MTTITIPILRNEPNQLKYVAGQTIFSTGDAGNAMYGVIDGEIEIIVRGKVVETVTEGGILGELALVDPNPRSATAVAKTDCTVVAINEHRFMTLVAQNPWFSVSVMRILAERIRRWGI